MDGRSIAHIEKSDMARGIRVGAIDERTIRERAIQDWAIREWAIRESPVRRN
jgi:hypothetical protein